MTDGHRLPFLDLPESDLRRTSGRTFSAPNVTYSNTPQHAYEVHVSQTIPVQKAEEIVVRIEEPRTVQHATALVHQVTPSGRATLSTVTTELVSGSSQNERMTSFFQQASQTFSSAADNFYEQRASSQSFSATYSSGTSLLSSVDSDTSDASEVAQFPLRKVKSKIDVRAESSSDRRSRKETSSSTKLESGHLKVSGNLEPERTDTTKQSDTLKPLEPISRSYLGLQISEVEGSEVEGGFPDDASIPIITVPDEENEPVKKERIIPIRLEYKPGVFVVPQASSVSIEEIETTYPEENENLLKTCEKDQAFSRKSALEVHRRSSIVIINCPPLEMEEATPIVAIADLLTRATVTFTPHSILELLKESKAQDLYSAASVGQAEAVLQTASLLTETTDSESESSKSDVSVVLRGSSLCSEAVHSALQAVLTEESSSKNEFEKHHRGRRKPKEALEVTTAETSKMTQAQCYTMFTPDTTDVSSELPSLDTNLTETSQPSTEQSEDESENSQSSEKQKSAKRRPGRRRGVYDEKVGIEGKGKKKGKARERLVEETPIGEDERQVPIESADESFHPVEASQESQQTGGRQFL